MGLTVDSSQLTFLQSHMTQKLGEIEIKCHSLRISGQLPAPTVNGRGDSC